MCCICSVSPSCHLVSRPPPPAGRNLHISPVSPAPDFPNSIFTFVTLCKWYSVRQYLAALSILPISSKAFPYYFCQVAGARYFHLHHKMKERGRRRGSWDEEFDSVFSFSERWCVCVCLWGRLKVALGIVKWLKADERRKGSKWGLERAGLVPQEWHSLNKFYSFGAEEFVCRWGVWLWEEFPFCAINFDWT